MGRAKKFQVVTVATMSGKLLKTAPVTTARIPSGFGALPILIRYFAF